MAGLPRCRPCTAPGQYGGVRQGLAERGAQAARQFWHAVFEGSFYGGVADTSAALREFARLIGDDDLSHRTEMVIAREEALANAALAPWRKNWPASARSCTPAG